MERESNNNFSVEKPDKHYFSQVIKAVKVNKDKACGEHEPLMWYDDENDLPLWLSSLKPKTSV